MKSSARNVITEDPIPTAIRSSFRWRQKMKRRDFFRKAGIGSATLVSLPALAHALPIADLAGSPLKPGELPANPFVILLRCTSKRVVRCPDLWLSLLDGCADA